MTFYRPCRGSEVCPASPSFYLPSGGRHFLACTFWWVADNCRDCEGRLVKPACNTCPLEFRSTYSPRYAGLSRSPPTRMLAPSRLFMFFHAVLSCCLLICSSVCLFPSVQQSCDDREQLIMVAALGPPVNARVALFPDTFFTHSVRVRPSIG